MHPCPVCQEKDQSASVTAIVRSGSNSTYGSGTTHHGGSAGYVGNSFAYMGGSASHHQFASHGQSDLARTLDLHVPPPPSNLPLFVGGTALILFVMALLGMTGIAWGVGLMGLALAIGYRRRGILGGLGCLILLIPLTIALGLAFGDELLANVDSLFRYAAPAVAAAGIGWGLWTRKVYKDGEPERQRVAGVWSRLFYCSRDDVVFDPEAGRHAPAPQINALLHTR